MNKIITYSVSFLMLTLILPSCSSLPAAAELIETNVKSITASQITLENGKSFNIPHSGEEGYTTLVLTRHAEKEKNQKDPDLTQVGKARAKNLSKILDTFAPDFIYTTSVRRCVMTVMPLAKKLKKPNVHYQATQYYELFDKITKEHKANRVLIVGHSNTIPSFLNLLVGEKRYEDMQESEYSSLFVVQTKGFGESEVFELRY